MLFKKNIYTLIFQTQMTWILFIGIQRRRDSFERKNPRYPRLKNEIITLLTPSPLSAPTSHQPHTAS